MTETPIPTKLSEAVERVRDQIKLAGPFSTAIQKNADLALILAALEARTEALTQITRLRTDLKGNYSMGSHQSDIARQALTGEAK